MHKKNSESRIDFEFFFELNKYYYFTFLRIYKEAKSPGGYNT